MGKIIEFIFTRVYVAMLVTGIFWVLTICGGAVSYTHLDVYKRQPWTSWLGR